MPYPVANLIEDRPVPVSIDGDEPVVNALGLMIENDFSQLPVTDMDGHPLGMVSYEGILRAVRNFKI